MKHLTLTQPLNVREISVNVHFTASCQSQDKSYISKRMYSQNSLVKDVCILFCRQICVIWRHVLLKYPYQENVEEYLRVTEDAYSYELLSLGFQVYGAITYNPAHEYKIDL